LALTLLLAPACRLPAAASDAEFLLLQPAASAAALGGAYGARRGSLESLRYNPAGLDGLSGLCADVGHDSAPGDWSHEWAAIGGRWGALSLGMEVLLSDLQSFTLYDASGQAADNATSSSQNLGLGVATQLSRWASLGAEAHFFRSQLYIYQSWGWAGDLGLNLHWPGLPWSLGLAVQNMGAQSAYISDPDALPLCGRASLQGDWRLDRAIHLRPSVEFVGYQDPLRPQELRAGLELSAYERLDLRGGWLSSADWSQPSLGLGLHWDALELDYAYLPGGDLGNSQVLELRFNRL
jgi:hypothetical protein